VYPPRTGAFRPGDYSRLPRGRRLLLATIHAVEVHRRAARSTRLAFDCSQRVHGGAREKDACEVLNGTSERAFVASARRRSGNACFFALVGSLLVSYLYLYRR